jgi:acyl-CoA thioester hydrolase
MKSAPHRLEIASYATIKIIPTRLSDVNAARHVSNTAIASIYDDARYDILLQVLPEPERGLGSRTVMAQTNLRYIEEIRHPAPLGVATGVSRIGKSSFELFQGLFRGDVCVGLCDTTYVHCNADGPFPLDDAKRQILMALAYKVPVDQA